MSEKATALRLVSTTKPEPEIAWHHTDRIEPGEYSAYCRSAKVYRDSHFGRWVCALQFNVLDDSHFNLIAAITCFLNLGSGEKPRATSRRSRYWQAWIAANGGQPPARSSKLAPTIFVRRFARVEVVDVQKDFHQMAVSSEQVYSKVERILSWETGELPRINYQEPTTNLGIREKGC